MDDVYIGAEDPRELLARWKKVLSICAEANIRLGPKKVIITPKTTKILGWTWHQGGKLTPDSHASSRLKESEPPQQPKD